MTAVRYMRSLVWSSGYDESDRAARSVLPRPRQLGLYEVPAGVDNVERQPTDPTFSRRSLPLRPPGRMVDTPTDVLVDDQPDPLRQAQ
ncbi:hypothetical protein BAY59_02380 [Prauserella coralliicola]|nr:hypothetical protein BAY59_02380 [Prauserella coralliicola]